MPRALAVALLLCLLGGGPAPARADEEAKPLVTFHFTDEDVRRVVTAIAEFAQANVILHPDVQGKVTMHVVEVPWDEALRAAVAAGGGAVVEEKYGILRIVPAPPAAPAIEAPAPVATLRIHDVADLLGSVPNLLDELRLLLPGLDAKLQGASALVVRGPERVQAVVAAHLTRLRREQVLHAELAALKAELDRLRTELDQLRAQVAALEQASAPR